MQGGDGGAEGEADALGGEESAEGWGKEGLGCLVLVLVLGVWLGCRSEGGEEVGEEGGARGADYDGGLGR